MSPYLEPPTIPEGMTLAEYRSSRPRHLPLWLRLTNGLTAFTLSATVPSRKESHH